MRHRNTFLVLGFLILFVFITAYLSLNRDKVSAVGERSLSVLEFYSVNVIYKRSPSLKDIQEIDCDNVKPVVYSNLNLKALSPELRKKVFINALLPAALIANYRVLQERENLLKVIAKRNEGRELTELEKEYLEYLLSKYRAQSLEELLDKVKPVPVSLLLAQAAIESGWGTSRAFRIANNSFGMWTFSDRANHIRVVGTNIKLRKYENLLESVENYLYTLNVGWAYRDFRQKRFFTFDSLELADSLKYYSIQRHRYVRKIKRVILSNNLKKYDTCKLNREYLF